MNLLFVPTPKRDLTEEGKKAAEYEKGIVGGVEKGKEIDVNAYEKALNNSGFSHDEAIKYWNDVSNYDPYSRAGKDIDAAIAAQAPKVSINDGKISISAPKTILNSPLVAQIQEQLQSLKGSDLSSSEVSNAIKSLNDEISANVRNTMVEDTFGWTPQEFNDYQYAIQTVNTTNPMKSSNKIKGIDKDGNVQTKTPQEWVDYYRKSYSTDERTDAFLESLASDSPYGRTMALVLSKGRENPIYGFDQGERIGQGFLRARLEFEKASKSVAKGLVEAVTGNYDYERLKTLSDQLDIPRDKMTKSVYVSEDAFNKLKNEISGKTWDDLTDEQKAFVLKLGVSRESESIRPTDRDFIGGASDDLKEMSSSNKQVSKSAINRILNNSTYDEYEKTNNNYFGWVYNELTTSEIPEARLDKNRIWSNTEQTIGSIVGTLGRYAAEDAAVQGLTGMSMSKISDKLGEKIMNKLAESGFQFSSKGGKSFAQFIANLVGTIPEDAIQDTVDAVLTDNGEEIQKILRGEEFSDNLRNNFIFMAFVNMGMAGVSAVKRAQIAKKLKKIEDLNQKLDIDAISSDANDAIRARKNGGAIEVSDGKVYAVDTNGDRTELENITVGDATALQKLANEPDTKVETTTEEVVGRIPNNGDQNIAPWYNKENDLDWSGQINTARLYIAQNSPIDLESGSKTGVKGSIAWWLHDAWLDGDEEISRRWQSIPEEVREKILSDGTFSRSVSNNGLGTAVARMGIDNVYDPDIIDRAYADYLWKQYGADGLEIRAKAGASETPTKVETTDTPKIGESLEGVKKGGEVQPTVRVEVETPEGPVRVETVDYRFNNLDDATDTNIKVEATPAGVKHWHSRALNAIMSTFRTNLQEFRNRFGDVRASDFDWVWYNTKKGLTPDQIVGTKDPTTGRTITQNTMDAIKWWGDQSFTKKLRMGSRKALGLDGDMNVLGYLPHTNYDPANLSYDEALTGRLWQTASGSSVLKDGNYVGYGGTLEGRYRTFASNMLWDMRNKEIAAAKLIEEAQMEGKNLSPDSAMKMVEGGQKIQKAVNDSPSTKSYEKAYSSDSGYDKEAWDEMAKKTEEEAPKSGVSKSIHDNYQDGYVGANNQSVQSQPSRFGKTFNQQSDTMRSIKTRDGSMYDNGGADIVYSSQNAVELVERFTREGGDFREMLTEFIINHSKRSPQYAEMVADRWIAKMSEGPGELTKGKAIVSLSGSMYAEGMGRLRRWLVRAKYSEFDKPTREFMDNFLFRHMQMDSIKNNPTIGQKITDKLNKLTEYRYRALFYGNFKNALLQVSELSRLFTVFKWGDVANMLKRLSTDADFRDRVNIYIEAVAPETTYLNSELYGKYKKVAENAEIGEDGITFKKIGEKVDDIALAPINAAESLKNRTLIAALVEEADRKGLSGDEALRYIRQRFERVALAANEMGKIGLASNPLAKPMLFLQNFQIRELGMHYYNIKDATGTANSLPKAVLEATKYLTKVFGTKLATTLILGRLGYSASQTMGLDPFGLSNSYNVLDEEEMNEIDKQISGGVLTPFFSGGMTSLIADMYFMARKAYEDSNRQTVSDEAQANLEKSYGLAMPEDWKSLDWYLNLGSNFVPGSTFATRLGQMNEMMDTGWATSATGNKMYTAPNDALNTMLGYLFGRSATSNALQYNQNYGNSLLQTLGRFNPFRQYSEFDPIDTKNYSDWFNGSENDKQQFEKGRRYFQQQRDRILDVYEEAVRRGYSADEIAEAKNDMDTKLDELYDQLDRFVKAYENKNGTIDPAMTKQVINLLNTGRDVLSDTPEEAAARGQEDYSKALERYSQLGLSPVGTYSGPTESEPEKEVKYQGSPQWRTAKSAKYTLYDEAVDVLKQSDLVLKDIRNDLKASINSAYDNNDWDSLSKIQKQYLDAFDKVVSPIIATYGSGILNSTDVVEQIKDMLSTGTVSRSGDLIPSEQYRKDKTGRYRSMPLETVDVKKWAQQRFSSDIYNNPTVRSNSTADEDLIEIKRLIAENKPDRARARALQLKVRVDNQQRSLSRTDYQWLLDFLNNGGK